jgi:hypothetical protein
MVDAPDDSPLTPQELLAKDMLDTLQRMESDIRRLQQLVRKQRGRQRLDGFERAFLAARVYHAVEAKLAAQPGRKNVGNAIRTVAAEWQRPPLGERSIRAYYEAGAQLKERMANK